MRTVQSLFDRKSRLGGDGKTALPHYIAYRQIVSALLALLFLNIYGESLRLDLVWAVPSAIDGVSISDRRVRRFRREA